MQQLRRLHLMLFDTHSSASAFASAFEFDFQ
jgi:hypothetical protein